MMALLGDLLATQISGAGPPCTKDAGTGHEIDEATVRFEARAVTKEQGDTGYRIRIADPGSC